MDTSLFSTISFPGLGISINPPMGFSLFGLDIRFYGVIAVLGMILSSIYGLRRCKQFGLDENTVLDGILTIIPFALICARIYFCIFSWEYFADNPLSVFNIKQGGLAIYGGIIGGVIGILVFCKIKKISAKATLDISLLSVMVGHSLSRWGNFFNREAFGSITNNFLRMGLYKEVTASGDIVSSATMYYYHPTFLYESLWNLAGFVLLHFLSKKRKYDGQIALGYAAWYGLGRAWIEGLRTDSLYLGPFRISQVIAIISFVVAATILIIMAFKKHDESKLFVNVVANAEAETRKKEQEELTERARRAKNYHSKSKHKKR